MANAFVSNGTCYVAAGDEAHELMFPCGNSAYGHVTCCQAGDMCLSNNACFNYEFGVTYLAGCTDPEYEAEGCPEKDPYEDQPWTGLVYCNGTSNQWAVCEQEAARPTLTEPDFCFCPTPTAQRNVAFEAEENLDDVGRLPTELGEEVAWLPGFFPTDKTLTGGGEPTGTPTDTGTGTETGGSQTSDTEPPPSDTNSPPEEDSSSSGLSQGAKVGIGVGVGAAALLALAVLAFVFMRRRRKGKGSNINEEEDRRNTKVSELADDSATMAPSELDSRAARPWSMRSELQTPDTPLSLADAQVAGEKAGGADGDGRSSRNGGSHLRPTDVPSSLRPENGHGQGGAASPSLGPVAELPG